MNFFEIFKFNRETMFAKAISNISLSEFSKSSYLSSAWNIQIENSAKVCKRSKEKFQLSSISLPQF